MHFSVHILPAAVAAAAGVNSPVIPRLVQKFILIHFSFGQRQIELFCDPSIKFSSVCSFYGPTARGFRAWHVGEVHGIDL